MPRPVPTPMSSRRRVLAIGVAVAAGSLVIALWPRTLPRPEPPAHARGAPKAEAGSAAHGEPLLPDRDGLTTATAGDRANTAIDAVTAQTLTIVFEPLDEWGLVPWTTPEVGFGPDLGPVQVLMIGSAERAGIAVRTRTTKHDWVIDDGHMRRVAATVGQTARLAVANHLRPPEIDGEALPPGSERRFADFEPKGLARIQFREGPESIELTDWSRPPSFVGGTAGSNRLRGRVLTAARLPASDFRVHIAGPKTDGNAPVRGSSFESYPLPPGTYTVSAGSRLGGHAATTLHVTSNTTIDLVLQEGPALRGRVIDRAGEPVAHARLLWSTPAGDYRNHVLTAADGTFVIPDVSGEAGSLWACVPGEASQLPAVGRTVSPGDSIDFVLDRERCRGSVRVCVDVPAGVPSKDVSARLWQRGSGLGVRLVPLVPAESTEATAVFGRDEIPADHYRLELYCPGFGVIDAGTHWFDGTSRVVLDHLALPEPAHVTFELPPAEPTPAADAFELVRIGVAVDCRIVTGQPFAGPHLLGPGRYAIWWRDGTGTVRSHAFAVASAGELAVALPR